MTGHLLVGVQGHTPKCFPSDIFRVDASHEEDAYELCGTTITFMPDDSVVVPLWDEDGLLPDDPEWLNRALDLTSELVADIAVWGPNALGAERSQPSQATGLYASGAWPRPSESHGQCR